MNSLGSDPTLGQFDFIHTAKRKEEFHQIRRRILRNLADNSAHGIGNRSVEEDRTHPQACKIHPHLLTVT
jgi:hypothetical protein